MKKILMRSGISPLENRPIGEILIKNLLGDNSGNLIYANSVYRTLMTSEDMEIVPDRYTLRQRDVDEINETYDSYVIPMADMFRDTGIAYLDRMTQVIKKLKVPCIVVGVGLKNKLGADETLPHKFDDNVKEFMKAVLDKSAMVGIRGESTARYLKGLGFVEDRDFMVIGCPSMYMQGGFLGRKPYDIKADAKISVNSSILCSEDTLTFLDGIWKRYKNSVFIPQKIEELWTLYTGREYVTKTRRVHYPQHISCDIYQEDRVKFFVNAPDWINYLKTMDLSIGGRLHGNVAGIQAGIPSVLIPHDSRMMELIRYHHLPHVLPKEVKKANCLEAVLEKVDFDSMYQYHGENFERYGSFLDANGLDHIFKEEIVEQTPFDKKQKERTVVGAISSCIHMEPEQIAERWMHIYEAQMINYKNVIKVKNEDIATLKQRLKLEEKKFGELNDTRIITDLRMTGEKVLGKILGNELSNYDRLKKH